PLEAGQYFRATSIDSHVVLDTDTPHSFHVNSRLYGNHVSRLQPAGLPFRHPGILVYFEAQAMTGAMHEVAVQTVARQNVPGCPVHVTASDANPHGGNRSRLRFLNCPIPSPDASWRSPQKKRARNVAAIVAEYSTQVQYHQFIFPQALGRRPCMRQRGA